MLVILILVYNLSIRRKSIVKKGWIISATIGACIILSTVLIKKVSKQEQQ